MQQIHLLVRKLHPKYSMLTYPIIRGQSDRFPVRKNTENKQHLTVRTFIDIS